MVVASTYSKVGGVYDFGFRHDPEHPIESLAEYCLGCYTNLNFPQRIDMICKYIDEYQADGLLINSIKSCNSFSAGQLLILREVERQPRLARPSPFGGQLPGMGFSDDLFEELEQVFGLRGRGQCLVRDGDAGGRGRGGRGRGGHSGGGRRQQPCGSGADR